jgi:hypothetical protein
VNEVSEIVEQKKSYAVKGVGKSFIITAGQLSHNLMKILGKMDKIPHLLVELVFNKQFK